MSRRCVKLLRMWADKLGGSRNTETTVAGVFESPPPWMARAAVSRELVSILASLLLEPYLSGQPLPPRDGLDQPFPPRFCQILGRDTALAMVRAVIPEWQQGAALTEAMCRRMLQKSSLQQSGGEGGVWLVGMEMVPLLASAQPSQHLPPFLCQQGWGGWAAEDDVLQQCVMSRLACNLDTTVDTWMLLDAQLIAAAHLKGQVTKSPADEDAIDAVFLVLVLGQAEVVMEDWNRLWFGGCFERVWGDFGSTGRDAVEAAVEAAVREVVQTDRLAGLLDDEEAPRLMGIYCVRSGPWESRQKPPRMPIAYDPDALHHVCAWLLKACEGATAREVMDAFQQVWVEFTPEQRLVLTQWLTAQATRELPGGLSRLMSNVEGLVVPHISPVTPPVSRGRQGMKKARVAAKGRS